MCTAARCLLMSALAGAAGASVDRAIVRSEGSAALDVERAAGPTTGGKCINEGDFSVGNHCVYLSGSKLDDFQAATKQDFGNPSEWCVCLHLYRSWGGGGGDTSACSKGALEATDR
mmetsp:Transcript_22791/g.59503  ORF Transcript_22791/g.59503 Transcript_22791/m.59503 type:complete len:116 (-) Transcript_22791:420-767(-)